MSRLRLRCSFFVLCVVMAAGVAMGQSTTTTLTASPTTMTVGSPVSLSAQVATTGTGVPSGTVMFLDGSTTLGSATLSGGGTASPQLVTLASVGVNLFSAANGGTLVSVDVNGDTRQDLVYYGYATAGSGQYQFQVFLNNGNGTYTALAVQTYPLTDPQFLDVNGDGHMDIVSLTSDQTGVEALLGNGAGVFAAPVTLSGITAQATGESFSDLAIADLFGSGHPALLLGDKEHIAPNYYSAISIYKNNADGTFTYTGSVQLESNIAGNQGLWPSVVSMTVADLNGDHIPDVIASTESAGFPLAYVLLGQAGGTLQSEGPVFGTAVANVDVAQYQFAVGDFRHVNKLDVAMVTWTDGVPNSQTNNLSIYPGNGDGTFGTPKVMGTTVTSSGALSNYSPSIAAADLNGDGIPDLIDSYGYGYISNGDDTFTPTANYLGLSSLTSANICTPFCGGQVLPMPFGNATDTTIYLSRGAGVLELPSGSGVFPSASIQPTLAVGTHTLTASYAGNGTFSGSTSSAVTVTVNPIATTLNVSASPNPVTVNSPFTVTATVVPASAGTVSGTVTFRVGSSIQATVAVSGNKATYTSSLGIAGSQTITATYSGDATYGTSTGTVMVTANAIGTTLNVSASPNPVAVNNHFTVTATVVPANAGTVTGTVAFSVGGTVLATVAVSGNKATYTSSLGVVSSESITATYSGDTTYGTSSGSVTVTSMPGFGVAPGGSGSTLEVSYGGSVQTTIAVTGENNFVGTATLGCSGQPTGVTCGFSPTTLNISGTTAVTSTLTITVANTIGSVQPPARPFSRNELALAGALLAFALSGMRRKRWSRGLLAMLVLASLLGMAGCVGSGTLSTTAPQTVSFNVVATSGSYQTTTAYTLNVK